MKTYPYTCPKSKGRESDREFRSHAVSYPENNQQSTNKNMCNGENSDPRDHCLRYCHFAADFRRRWKPNNEYLQLREQVNDR